MTGDQLTYRIHIYSQTVKCLSVQHISCVEYTYIYLSALAFGTGVILCNLANNMTFCECWPFLRYKLFAITHPLQLLIVLSVLI